MGENEGNGFGWRKGSREEPYQRERESVMGEIAHLIVF